MPLNYTIGEEIDDIVLDLISSRGPDRQPRPDPRDRHDRLQARRGRREPRRSEDHEQRHEGACGTPSASSLRSAPTGRSASSARRGSPPKRPSTTSPRTSPSGPRTGGNARHHGRGRRHHGGGQPRRGRRRQLRTGDPASDGARGQPVHPTARPLDQLQVLLHAEARSSSRNRTRSSSSRAGSEPWTSASSC